MAAPPHDPPVASIATPMLRAGRPEFGDALEQLQSRVVAAVVGRRAQEIGRYRLGRTLGTGSFGSVFEAEDTTLHRPVALKIVHARSKAHHRQVLREARMLATLSDPHIVPVFEVGLTDRGAPFVAMELVQGLTLRQWLDAEPRSWPQVVDVMLQAARGLWAAHRAGVVHRDFKPDNALVGDDGRLRVVDFGLARPMGTPGSTEDAARGSSLPLQLTPTGHVMGTPAYMAPEVFVGEPAGQSDQYSLCVTLYEALFGQRPFDATTSEELGRMLLTHHPRLPRDRRGVPSRVSAVVMRGLSREPEQRFATMERFIEALERGLKPRRRAPLVIAGVGLLGGLAAWGGVQQDHACVGGAAAWDRLHAAVVIPDEAVAPLQRYEHGWIEVERQVCLQRSGDARWAPRRCLEQRLDDARAVLEELARTDREQPDLGPTAALGRLTPAAACIDGTREVNPPPAPEDIAAVTELEAQLSQLRALNYTGRYGPGLQLSTVVLPQARERGYTPLVVEAASLHGRMQLMASDYEGAAAAYQEAYFQAWEGGMPRSAAHAASELIRVTGQYGSDVEAARQWQEHAETAFTRAGLDARNHMPFLQSLAGVAMRERDYPAAAAALEQAIDQLVASGRGRSTVYAAMLSHLSGVSYLREDYEGALAPSRLAAEIFEQHHGAVSASRASALNNLALSLQELGRNEEALAVMLDTLAIREELFTPGHIELGASYGNLGTVLGALGRIDEAIAYNDRARELFIARLGPDDPMVAQAYALRGGLYQSKGEAGRDDALADYRRALQIYQGAGPAHASDVQQQRDNIDGLEVR